MTATLRAGASPELSADRALGVELMAIEVERQLEGAEAQARDADVVELAARLAELHGGLADLADRIPRAASVAA